jgi:hypothetical protein
MPPRTRLACSAAVRWRFSTHGIIACRPGLYSALERQAARLGFADLLSLGDEPHQILGGFPAVARRPSGDAMSPEMLVRRMRNGR